MAVKYLFESIFYLSIFIIVFIILFIVYNCVLPSNISNNIFIPNSSKVGSTVKYIDSIIEPMDFNQISIENI
jgi:hypothetical protein